MIKVLICDDQLMVREGLKTILNNVDAGIEVVGLAYDGAHAIELIPQNSPDVVLMDLKMPGMNGIQAIRYIQENFRHVHVLVLTTYDADEWVFDAIRAGADGYLLKDADQDTLIKAIKDTAVGRTPVDPSVAGKLFEQVAQHAPERDSMLADKLTPRELELLSLLVRGYSNAQIAARLFLSEGTVRNYLSATFTKLGVSDRTQAAVLALKHGLIKPDKS
ncbi:MAG: response regulator transcription factor [Chloroflexota bacterium]|nr:response regulator transcription factor [Chloroflexota bacterium]